MSAVSQSAYAHCPWLEPEASGQKQCDALELVTTALQCLMTTGIGGAQEKIERGRFVTVGMMHIDF